MGGSSSTVFQVELGFEFLLAGRNEKPENSGKTLGVRTRTNDGTRPTHAAKLGNRTRVTVLRGEHITTATFALLRKLPFFLFLVCRTPLVVIFSISSKDVISFCLFPRLVGIIFPILSTDEQEVTAKGKPKLLKSKSAAPETLFKNVEFTIDPDAGEPVSYKTKGETGAQMNGYHEEKETVSEEKEDRPRDRSYTSGKYRRLEARPLRRSSISSVRKSDATVREKGKGYSFDDGLDQTGDGRRRGTQPLKIPSREEVRKFEAEAEFRPGTPGELIDATKGMTVVDIDMEEAPVEERKKKREEERKGVIDAVKTAAAGKSWVKRQEAQEGKVQKLGTLERRKAKSRRAMYPPLSVVLNPDEKETQEALEGIVQAANETESNPQKKMQLKMVDISLDDDTLIPSSERKAAGQTKAGPKTVSVATKNEPTPSPRSPTSPTSPGNKKPPAGSLVAARTARLTNLIANDFRPPTVKDKWAEREEWKKSSPVKNDAGKKFGKEEELEPTASPGAQRRSLPRVPSEEPFHSTKETTKIVQRKPTGKPRFRLGKVRKEIGEEKEEKIGKDSVDMGFVVLDLHDGISTPEKGMWQTVVYACSSSNIHIADLS